jgi:hypothetical protein
MIPYILWVSFAAACLLAGTTALAERADRDPADYRHPFQEHARPLLCVDEAGTTLIFLSDKDIGAVSYTSPDGRHTFSPRRFGRYTVTPHGVEDLD